MSYSNPANTIQTYIDADKIMPMEIYCGAVRDQLILIREAVHSLRTNSASEIDLHVQGKDWSISIKARK